jgi:hypothetical protein
MRISRESLEREAAATGFRAEILEKVIHLFSLLDGFQKHPFLKGKWALKETWPPFGKRKQLPQGPADPQVLLDAGWWQPQFGLGFIIEAALPLDRECNERVHGVGAELASLLMMPPIHAGA